MVGENDSSFFCNDIDLKSRLLYLESAATDIAQSKIERLEAVNKIRV